MKYCRNCSLPATLPSARIDESGLCGYCRKFKSNEDLESRRLQYRAAFDSLVQKCREPHAASHYDVLVAFSGGKDSTFTLDLLKNQFHLRILAMTFDHGFVSPYALENIRRVVETLGIDHIFFKPNFDLIRRIFLFSIDNEFHPLKALERASSICNSCMGLVKFVTLAAAIEKDIPLVAYGWSPGQAPLQSAIFKNQPSFVRKAQDLFLKPLQQAIGRDVSSYFLDERHFESESFPHNVNPLAFYHYREESIYQRIHELGWQPPKDTDPNSTNCLLNAFANQVHLEKHHYHPYAMELAELVREGVLTREQALTRLSAKPEQTNIEFVKNKLGL